MLRNPGAGLVLLFATAAALASCDRPQEDFIPSTAELQQNGWALLRLFDQPSLWLTQPGSPMVILDCNSSYLSFQVRDVPPAQAFPQPDLTVLIGPSEWSVQPVASMVGEQTALDADFVPHQHLYELRETMAAVNAGAEIAIIFNGETHSLPPIPAEQAAVFTDHCWDEWAVDRVLDELEAESRQP